MFDNETYINSRYKIQGVIAQGDLGPIYCATDGQTGNLCTLRPIRLEQEREVELFRNEAEKIDSLKHAGIVPPGRLEMTEDRQPFLVRQFFEGMPLEEIMRRKAPLPLPRACGIARQIAKTIEVAHHAGIIHGDLKPSNILIVQEDGQESVKVLGFGTYGFKKDHFISLANLAVRRNGQPLYGTAEYVSPEQSVGTGSDALDGQSDLYSLGVILYEMLTGEPPHRGVHAMEVLLAQIFAEPRPITERPGLEIPQAVGALVMRALAKKRRDRPAGPTALFDQLAPWAADAGALTQPAAPPALEEASPPFVPIAADDARAQDDRLAQAAAGGLEIDDIVEDASPPVIELPSAPPAQLRELDVRLDAPPPRSPDAPQTAAPFLPPPSPVPSKRPAGAAPVIFGNYQMRKKSKPMKRAAKIALGMVAAILLIAGGGCSWLYFTGRTYWFDPGYVKMRIESIFSSTSLESLPTDSSTSPPADAPSPATPPGTAPIQTQPASDGNAPSVAAPASSAPEAGLKPGAGSRAAPLVNHPATVTSPPPLSLSFQAHRNGTDTDNEAAITQSKPKNTSPAMNQTGYPEAVQDAITRGYFYFEHGNYNAAIRAYKEGLALSPSNPVLAAGLARARRARAAEAKYLQ